MSTLHTTRITQQSTYTQLRTAVLLLLSPFIGLAFVVLLPFAGLGMLAWVAGRALASETRILETARDVALFVAAPFIGLAYILLLPVAGLVMLATMEAKQLAHRAQAA